MKKAVEVGSLALTADHGLKRLESCADRCCHRIVSLTYV